MEEQNSQVQTTAEANNENSFKKRFIIIPVAIVLVLVFGYFYYLSTHFQSTDDAYVESHMVQLAPKVSGQVEEVYVTDNQEIKEGDLVVKIDDTDYKVRFEGADAMYKKALLAQSVAKANLKAVNSEIELAKADLERYRNLYATGAVSKQTLDNARTRYDGVLAKQLSAEEQIMSTTNNKVVDADIKSLKSQRDQAELHLNYTNVYAPISGRVTSKNVAKGAFVQAGQPLFVIAPDDIFIVANFKESQVGKMREGQEVEIKIDAYPNKKFKGKVDSIQRASGAKSSLFPPENAVGSFVKIVQRIPVKIVFDEEIDKNEYTIVSGMSVVPKVKVK